MTDETGEIKVSEAIFGGDEVNATAACLRRSWITQGPQVEKFEHAFAEYLQAKPGRDAPLHAIACSSGTAALHLAVRACARIEEHHPERTSAHVPNLTFIATANAALYAGLTVHLHDVDLGDWCLDLKKLAVRLKAVESLGCGPSGGDLVLPVSIYDSRPYVSHPLHSLSPHMAIIEDLSQTLSPPRSPIATYSFYGSKIITTGEGGMVVTRSRDLANRVRLFRGQGQHVAGRYSHTVVGYNYRMTDLQASIGLAQLARADGFIARRREVINLYRKLLGGHGRISLQGGERSDGWMMGVVIHGLTTSIARVIADSLAQHGIETRPFFLPLHRQPAYAPLIEQGRIKLATAFSASDYLYEHGLCLPTHPGLTNNDVEHVCDRLLYAIDRVE